MTLKELYNNIGGNYETVIVRMIKEDRIVKYVKMFIEDPSYDSLMSAMEKEDIDAAFSSAHTLKGVTANLSFDRLNAIAINVTNALRNRDIALAREFMPELNETYKYTIDSITNF